MSDPKNVRARISSIRSSMSDKTGAQPAISANAATPSRPSRTAGTASSEAPLRAEPRATRPLASSDGTTARAATANPAVPSRDLSNSSARGQLREASHGIETRQPAAARRAAGTTGRSHGEISHPATSGVSGQQHSPLRTPRPGLLAPGHGVQTQVGDASRKQGVAHHAPSVPGAKLG